MTAVDIVFEGLLQIVITPFHADGSIDFRSVDRLTRSVLAEGASALTVLGVSSEAAYLDEAERRKVIEAVQTASEDAVPIVIGISAADTAVVAERAAEAQEVGAAAVMVAPPKDVSKLTDHYAAVAASAPGLPIVLQDFPSLSQAKLEAGMLAAVTREVATVAAIYHEDPPTPKKIDAVRTLAPDIPQIGGLGGLWLPWELRAGATAVMTGFAFPEFMAATVRAALAGDWASVFETHDLALPLIVWEAQPGVGLANRKAMLVERGLIETAALRRPIVPLASTAADAADLASALAHRRERAA